MTTKQETDMDRVNDIGLSSNPSSNRSDSEDKEEKKPEKKPIEKPKAIGKPNKMSDALLRWVTAKLIEDRTFMARVAEEAGMYDDMMLYIKDLMQQKTTDFTVEERNLVSVAFKGLISPERRSIKLVGDLSEHPKLSKFSTNMKTY